MGVAARRLISRFTGVFWLAAIALTVVQFFDFDPGFTDALISVTGLGTAGLISGTIGDVSRRDKALQVAAILASQPAAGDGREAPPRHLRAL